MNNKEYDNNLHKNMDKLASRYFTVMENLMNERQKLESTMRNGFLQMAKSRYSMGNKAISKLQLPTENLDSAFTALTVVDSNELDDGLIKRIDFLPALRDNNIINEAEFSNNIRKRNQIKEDELLNDDDENTNDENTNLLCVDIGKTNGGHSKSRDPMKWFGILVPQSLRNCQQNFKECNTIVCQIASLQSELEAIRQEYKKLNKTLNLKNGNECEK